MSKEKRDNYDYLEANIELLEKSVAELNNIFRPQAGILSRIVDSSHVVCRLARKELNRDEVESE